MTRVAFSVRDTELNYNMNFIKTENMTVNGTLLQHVELSRTALAFRFRNTSDNHLSMPPACACACMDGAATLQLQQRRRASTYRTLL